VSHLVNNDGVAVSTEHFYMPMTTCPIAVKVLLLGDGVATVGHYNGKDRHWRGWYPLPRIQKDSHDQN